jgi:hypothetical protein
VRGFAAGVGVVVVVGGVVVVPPVNRPCIVVEWTSQMKV